MERKTWKLVRNYCYFRRQQITFFGAGTKKENFVTSERKTKKRVSLKRREK